MNSTLVNELRGKKVFVTGGTGFIGGRVIEKLITDYDVQIKALVPSYRNLFRIARYPIEIIHGDILDPEILQKGLQGYDIVIHCAFGNKGSSDKRKRINSEGTRNVLEASRSNKVKRVVHISTFSVYDLNYAVIDESTPFTPVSTAYTDSKIEAEKLVYEYHKMYDLPITIIQPSIVYGPFATGWTVGVLEQLLSGKVILINNGSGYCNAVYVDDVVDSIFLASVNKNAIGEKFLISYEKPITWKEFYSSFEELSKTYSTVSMTVGEAKSVYMKHKKNERKRSLLTILPKLLKDENNFQELRSSREFSYALKLLSKIGLYENVKKRFLNTMNGQTNNIKHSLTEDNDIKQLIIIPPNHADWLSKRPVADITKAKRTLGYKPKYDLKKGMTLTKKWVEWANLIPETK